MYKRFFLSIISGILGVFSFSPYNIWPLAIISFTGLLITTYNSSIKNAALQGFIWGLSLFGLGIHWIYICLEKFSEMSTIINIFITNLLVIYLSLYPTIFSILLNKIHFNNNTWKFIIGSPILWSITEFLRSWLLTGFPWLQFGYSQIDGPLKGLAPIFGVKFITFIITIICGIIVLALIKKKYQFY